MPNWTQQEKLKYTFFPDLKITKSWKNNQLLEIEVVRNRNRRLSKKSIPSFVNFETDILVDQIFQYIKEAI